MLDEYFKNQCVVSDNTAIGLWLYAYAKTGVESTVDRFASRAIDGRSIDTGRWKKNGAHKVEADNLAQQIKNFEKEMELRQRVLSVLNQSEISNGNGFSSYFDELGKDIMSNVWLNRIRLQEGGEYVQLTGLAFRADDILSFMKTLYQGKVFGSKN